MGGQAAPPLNVTPEQMAAFESARGQINPVEFGTELLKAGEQIDPLELKSLRDTLKQANLPPAVIDAIGQMVDTILAEPEKYAEIRSKFLAEGVPEDLLPEQFDAGFFAALNLALDQINTSFAPEAPTETEGIGTLPMGTAEPQAFAKGGIAQLKPIPAGLAQMGRKGDTMLAHITPSEARMLRRRGGSGTINPSTGLPEFFLDKVFKAVGNAFKSVGSAIVKGVKAVASGIKKFANTTVGRVVIGVALSYFLGPAAASFLGVSSAAGVAAVSGFIGGFGSTLIAGKGIKEALKIGAIGGVGAGIGAGVMGGANAFTAGSYAGPTTVAGQWDNLVSGAKNLVGMGTPAPTGAQAFPVPGEAGTPLNVSPTTVDLGASPTSLPDVNQLGYQPQAYTPANISGTPDTSGFTYTAEAPTATASGPSAVTTTTVPAAAPAPTAATPSAIDTGGALGAEPVMGAPTAPTPGTPPAGGTPSFVDRVTTGAKDLFNKFMPGSSDPAEILSQATQKADLAIAGNPALAASKNALVSAYVKELTPSTIGKYAPLALGGLGIMSLTGGFKSEPSEAPNLAGTMVTGEQLLAQNPEKYGAKFGGVQRVKASPTNYYNPTNYQSQAGNVYGINPIAPVQRFAEGGITSLDGYPRKQGAINGPGTGTSDSIKALLSDGEFVFTAKAVRGAGQGSRRKGAKRMYQLMRSLEGKA